MKTLFLCLLSAALSAPAFAGQSTRICGTAGFMQRTMRQMTSGQLGPTQNLDIHTDQGVVTAYTFDPAFIDLLRNIREETQICVSGKLQTGPNENLLLKIEGFEPN